MRGLTNTEVRSLLSSDLYNLQECYPNVEFFYSGNYISAMEKDLELVNYDTLEALSWKGVKGFGSLDGNPDYFLNQDELPSLLVGQWVLLDPMTWVVMFS